ncbi:MAG TPA: zinc-binding dehydrogenase [Acidimicrobiia bacterium]|nr:zinc-binding dehydrogenase [Acidimicrobiia bacterium]
MHAVTVADGALRWREHPDPVPGDDELLVDVRAAGVNAADLLQRQGLYPAPPGSPADIPGMELAGVVLAAGVACQRFRAGDRVMAVVGGGAQAERAIVHERVALRVPPDLPWPEAGGFPEVFTTAHDALLTQCGLAMGERVLIQGAAGGVGVAGVQVAARAGARVVAAVRSEARRDEVAELGAACGTVDVVAPEDAAARGPYDVVLEVIGGPNLSDDLEALATGGRIAVVVVGAGAHADVNLLALMGKRGRIHGSTLRARPLEQKARAAQLLASHVLPLLEAGQVRVPVEATVPMEEATAAYERFAAGGKFGKIVLVNS